MRLVFAVILSLLILTVLAMIVFSRGGPAASIPKAALGSGDEPTFVGREACIDCHASQHALWVGSDHDRAMEVADEQTVLGDFDDATLVHDDLTSTFTRDGRRFVVHTDGPDGLPADHDVAYTFGVTPLQQYLVAFPGGRYQAAATAWDTRAATEGGQRWFHLYPDEHVNHTDALHWTRPNQNWNFMCAECHSTNLEKGYDAATDTYDTTWSEIDVSCEACHGPASAHVRAAESPAGLGGDSRLLVNLKDHDGGFWEFEPDAVTANRSVPRPVNPQVDACGRCHARRGVIRADYEHGRPLLDTHRPSLLVDPLYYADGQIREEVYVYGSFLQSAMYKAGVTCSDCHEPHGGKVRASGNALCLQCHLPEAFETPAHHFHEPGGPGASCVDCHMPERTYMQIDPRRDHSIRVPRPDLSVAIGTPNACTMCHVDRSDAWAASATRAWYGTDRPARPHFGEAIHAGRTGAVGTAETLAELAVDPEQPGIARATALSLLARSPGPATRTAAIRVLTDDDPLVRSAAASALANDQLEHRVAPALRLLHDPVLGVRLEAARVLAPVPPEMLTAAQRDAVLSGIDVYIAAEMTNADRPESHLNVGVVLTDQRRLAEAEAAYRSALHLDPTLTEATVNLVDLCRMSGRDKEGEALLRGAMLRSPEVAILHHVLGLLLVRTDRRDEALAALGRACELGPGTPRYDYVYAVALDSVGRRREAIAQLETALLRHPREQDLLGLREELTR